MQTEGKEDVILSSILQKLSKILPISIGIFSTTTISLRLYLINNNTDNNKNNK